MLGPIDQALARRLKELREHAKISLAEVAAAIGVTKATVWQYERGRRRISALQLQGLARALYCEERYLHTPLGSPLPRLSIRPQRPTGSTDWKSPALSANCRRQTRHLGLTKRVSG